MALLVDQITTGGTEKQFLALATELATNGHQIDLFSLRPPSESMGPHLERFLGRGGRLQVPRTRFARRFPLLSCYWWLIRGKSEIVYAGMTRTMLAAALPLFRHVPVVMARRSMPSAWPRAEFTFKARKWSIKRADAVVANSRAVADEALLLEGIQPSRMHVVPNGLARSLPPLRDVPGPAERTEALIRIASVANMRPEKNHRVLLEALGNVLGEGLAFQALLAGDGELRPELERQAERLQLPVKFLGSVEDPQKLLEEADIFVQHSSFEGLSNSLLEAMSSGCAIVATDVGGTHEALADSGLEVPPKNATVMANAIACFIESEPLRREYSDRARDRSQEFTLSAMAERHLALFSSLSPGSNRLTRGEALARRFWRRPRPKVTVHDREP